ncbi:Carbamoyltransferase [Balamuthia mandrillaris]
MELQNVLLKYSMAVAGTSSLLYLLGFHTWLLPTLCLTVFVCASILVGSYLPRGGAIHGYHSNLHPEMGALCQRLATPLFHALFHLCGYRAAASGFAAKKREELRRRVDAGETVYLVGINSGVHNAGIALVEVSKARGIQLLYNFEEERYSGDKHDTGYPRHSMHELCKILTKKGIELDKVVAFVSGWDHIESAKILIRTGVETFPLGIWNFFPSRYKNVTFFFNFGPLMNTSFLLHQQLTSYFSQSKSGNKDEKKKNEQKEIEEEDEERKKATMPTKAGWKQWPIISSRHHDNHAYFSFLVSPFADSREPVMIVVMDGQGDDASVSFYVSEWSQKQQRNSIRCQYINHTTIDSLGLLYALISSTQGGWTALSSEGRYMGASAFGNMCRLTNPYYKRLRQIVFLRDNGEILLNRAFTNWQYDMNRPYTQLLKDILGEPIPHEKLWNPDAILNVNDIKHAAITRDRVDKASALQLVFEDCVFHVIEHMIRSTKGASTKLVWTGGTALNCLASMRLVDAFDESYYDRYYPQQEIEEIGTAKGKGKDKGKGKGKKEAEEKKTESRRLHIWVPPVPGDAGVAAGAAFRFAATCGANFSSSGLSSRLQHAFYCGTAPTASSILAALERHKKEVAFQQLGSIKKLKATKKTNKKGEDEDEGGEEDEKVVKAVADLMAFIVSKDGIVGIYQGSAETGPRALGHRTILANPVNAMTQENLNKHVKYRERVRPLAPMVTLEAAKELFHLSEGANNDDDYNAYNWMVLTTMVKEEARSKIPAVVHADGTSRLQIVRKETDRLCWEYLKAMGQRVGVEVSVNTSLNVGTPIVQTPEQVVDCLKRSKGMHAIFMVSEEGRVFVVWDKEEVEASAGLKDGGKKLKGWMAEWKEESGFQF